MSTTSTYFPLATETFTGTLPDSGPGSSQSGSDAGAAGSSNTGFGLSHGGLIAIIIVVVVVAVLGVSSATLFYLAKKREWKIRESIRRSARRVVTALTPRRSEFPKSVKDGGGPRSKARMRLDDVPPTPKLRPEDLEKGLSVTSTTSSGGSRNKKDTRWT